MTTMIRDVAMIETAAEKLKDQLATVRAPLAELIAAFRIAGCADWADADARAAYSSMADSLESLRRHGETVIRACALIGEGPGSQDLLAKADLGRSH